jgi:glutaredoxin-like protein
MTVIAEKDRDTLRAMLARELVDDVELLFFTRSRVSHPAPEERACETCDEMAELLVELVALSERLRLTTYDVRTDSASATRYNVTALPTVLLRRATVTNDAAANIRFLGLPAGYEFTTLVADVVDISKGRTDLAPATLNVVRALTEPVHIQVFVTPSCPSCPRAARLAHQLAMENPVIVADVIEANEFPALSERYAARSVPKTIINNRVQFVGALPEAKVLEALVRATAHA